MFTEQLKIMLYVTNVEAASQFWQKIGFVEVERAAVDGTVIVEIAPSKTANTQLVLYDRDYIEKHSPEVLSNTPSLMFFSDDITALYKKMREAHVHVGDLVQLPNQLVFNFADNEENYFAVSGK